jgi:hypothetical protein
VQKAKRRGMMLLVCYVTYMRKGGGHVSLEPRDGFAPRRVLPDELARHTSDAPGRSWVQTRTGLPLPGLRDPPDTANHDMGRLTQCTYESQHCRPRIRGSTGRRKVPRPSNLDPVCLGTRCDGTPEWGRYRQDTGMTCRFMRRGDEPMVPDSESCCTRRLPRSRRPRRSVPTCSEPIFPSLSRRPGPATYIRA